MSLTKAWRKITLGELQDELTRIKTDTDKLNGEYKLLPPDGPERDVAFQAGMDRGYELHQDLRKVCETLFPLIELLYDREVFVVVLGDADSIARWIQSNVFRQGLTAKLTSVGMNEDHALIYLNLETRTAGQN
jgi:hypothetical protein